MLEMLIVGLAFSWIAIKFLVWLIDLECRHSNSPEKRQEWLGVAQGVEQVLTLPSWIYAEQDDLTELELEE